MSEGLRAVSLPQPGGSWAELGRVAARRSCYRRGERDQVPRALQGVKTRVSEDGEVRQLWSDTSGCGEVGLLRAAAPVPTRPAV